MAKKEIAEKDKPMSERWKDYIIALFKFILSWLIWLTMGCLALWAFQNKSTLSSLPSSPENLPYVNPNPGRGVAASGEGGVFDTPLFSYKPPVGFPYGFRGKEGTVREGPGAWFSRTEIGTWAFARKALFTIGNTLAIGFNLLAKLPELPGINYYDTAELVAVYLLPILVIFGLLLWQPIATTVLTLISSFYDNSWIWGLICLCFVVPMFLLAVANIIFQNVYLAGFWIWMPLFSGGFRFTRKTLFKNRMILLWTLCAAAIIISISYLPTQVTIGMAIGFILILLWHYLFGPVTSQAMSKLGQQFQNRKSESAGKDSSSTSPSTSPKNEIKFDTHEQRQELSNAVAEAINRRKKR